MLVIICKRGKKPMGMHLNYCKLNVINFNKAHRSLSFSYYSRSSQNNLSLYVCFLHDLSVLPSNAVVVVGTRKVLEFPELPNFFEYLPLVYSFGPL